MQRYLLAIDQGTTNSRAIIFNRNADIVSMHEIGLRQSYPQIGWVEQDADELYRNTVTCCREALKIAKLSAQAIAAVGISNQRETTIIWDKLTGVPIYPAIVWQDRRTSHFCRTLALHPLAATIPAKTGLLLDPYFSASKIAWILDHITGARERAMRGELLFGTVDTYLLWKLTNGQTHATDATNASRTLLFNIHTQVWDETLLNLFNIPKTILPTVMDNTADFGSMDPTILGAPVPITGMAGDQQAATIGQACFQPGMVKTTYGTGCFMLLNTGDRVMTSSKQLLSTVAYRIAGKVTYGVEGSIFSAGVTIKWLRDTLHMIQTASESETIAKQVSDTDGVYLIPAFNGLGAPYWDPEARGALLGLTQKSNRDHIVRAALESVAYQSRDLLEAMHADMAQPLTTMRVDGGMTANNWLMQLLADILDLTVERPRVIETTALGAACLAGLQIGMYHSLEDIAEHWCLDSRYQPVMSKTQRDQLYVGWQTALQRVLTH